MSENEKPEVREHRALLFFALFVVGIALSILGVAPKATSSFAIAALFTGTIASVLRW